MPTIEINKKEFLSVLGKRLSDEDIESKISMMGVSVEEVKEKEIIVEVFANRPDLLNLYGLARAVSSFLGISQGLKEYPVHDAKYVVTSEKITNDWPYAVCAVVKGLNLNDEKVKEIIQLQEKLGGTFLRKRKKGGLGLYPLEKIKFPVRFTSELPKNIKFRPLEGGETLSAQEILKQHPKGKAYKHIVENWKKYPLFIDANNNILSMPPIINAHELGKITEETTEVFVESTGTDLNTITIALNILVTSLADMGGRIYGVKMISGTKETRTPDLKPREWKFDSKYINKRIGLELKETEIKVLLEKMGYDVKKENGELIALVPAYRADIIHQVDLVEDVAIAYGFDNLKEEIPNVATSGQESKIEVFKRKIAEILIGLGLVEVHTYNLINSEDQTTKMNINLKYVELANALSEEYNSLRSWVLPSLMDVLKKNKHHEYPQHIFGFGNAFSYNIAKENGVDEKNKLTIALCNNKANVTEIKQVTDVLTKALGISYEIKERDHKSFIPGRVGSIRIRDVEVGIFGELSPQVLENFGLEMPVAALEISIDELFRLVMPFSK